MDLGDVGARGEAHGVVGRGHGSPGVCRREMHLGSEAAAAAAVALELLLGSRGVLLVLLLGSRGVPLLLQVGHCEEGEEEEGAARRRGSDRRSFARRRCKPLFSQKEEEGRVEKEPSLSSLSLFLLSSLSLRLLRHVLFHPSTRQPDRQAPAQGQSGGTEGRKEGLEKEEENWLISDGSKTLALSPHENFISSTSRRSRSSSRRSCSTTRRACRISGSWSGGEGRMDEREREREKRLRVLFWSFCSTIDLVVETPLPTPTSPLTFSSLSVFFRGPLALRTILRPGWRTSATASAPPCSSCSAGASEAGRGRPRPSTP